MVKIVPSLLAADFVHRGEQISSPEGGGLASREVGVVGPKLSDDGHMAGTALQGLATAGRAAIFAAVQRQADAGHRIPHRIRNAQAVTSWDSGLLRFLRTIEDLCTPSTARPAVWLLLEWSHRPHRHDASLWRGGREDDRRDDTRDHPYPGLRWKLAPGLV